MSNDQVSELDRNMDTVFDNLYVLNTAVAAIVESLPPEVSCQVVRALDEALDQIGGGISNAPGQREQMRLNAWRNRAAKIAGLESRRL